MRGRARTSPGMDALPTIDLAGVDALAGAPGVTLLEFGAERCQPCKALVPVLAAVDCDRDPALAERFLVRSMPTLVLLRGGREVGRVIGLRPRAFIAGVLDRALAGDVAIASP